MYVLRVDQFAQDQEVLGILTQNRLRLKRTETDFLALAELTKPTIAVCTIFSLRDSSAKLNKFFVAALACGFARIRHNQTSVKPRLENAQY